MGATKFKQILCIGPTSLDPSPNSLVRTKMLYTAVEKLSNIKITFSLTGCWLLVKYDTSMLCQDRPEDEMRTDNTLCLDL